MHTFVLQQRNYNAGITTNARNSVENDDLFFIETCVLNKLKFVVFVEDNKLRVLAIIMNLSTAYMYKLIQKGGHQILLLQKIMKKP